MESFGCCFFLGDVISGVDLGLFGQDQGAVRANTKSQLFD